MKCHYKQSTLRVKVPGKQPAESKFSNNQYNKTTQLLPTEKVAIIQCINRPDARGVQEAKDGPRKFSVRMRNRKSVICTKLLIKNLACKNGPKLKHPTNIMPFTLHIPEVQTVITFLLPSRSKVRPQIHAY